MCRGLPVGKVFLNDAALLVGAAMCLAFGSCSRDALSSSLPTTSNMKDREVPMDDNVATAATDTSLTIRPYSIAPAPVSSLMRFLNADFFAAF